MIWQGARVQQRRLVLGTPPRAPSSCFSLTLSRPKMTPRMRLRISTSFSPCASARPFPKASSAVSPGSARSSASPALRTPRWMSRSAHVRVLTVCNTAAGGGAPYATAELALGLMIAAARAIPAADRTLRAGGFQRGVPVGVSLAGKTLGIVGLGRLGARLALLRAGARHEGHSLEPEPDCGEGRAGRRAACRQAGS